MGDHKNFSQLPPIVELAARVRAGETVNAIAGEYGVSRTTILNRFSTAGFTYEGVSQESEARLELKAYLKSVALRWAEPWMSEGICSQVDGDLWFPEKGSSTAPAKRICMGCPVRERCLEWALDNNERFGVYGGKSERDRRKIAKERQVAA